MDAFRRRRMHLAYSGFLPRASRRAVVDEELRRRRVQTQAQRLEQGHEVGPQLLVAGRVQEGAVVETRED